MREYTVDMDKVAYAKKYRHVDFREHPELYSVGVGEQGVLMAEPYKSEILPFWRFRTEAIARVSSAAIYKLYEKYKSSNDFVGMDMARKYLQMGFTRARRYANHPSGKKYDKNGVVIPQSKDALTSEKARAADVFYIKYSKVKNDPQYQFLKRRHIKEVQRA